MDLVPIKVMIPAGLVGGRRQAIYPPFNEISPEHRDNMDWCYFVDKTGGWHYDQTADHSTDTPDSPMGIQYGMLLVPAGFAQEAAQKWPDKVTVLSEAEAQAFYEQKVHVNDPIEFIDSATLEQIQQRRAIPLLDDAWVLKALDPEDPTPGVRRNKLKTFAGFKAKFNATIIQP